jgi:hypothetical protein
MARHVMTPRRRAALRKAQLASAQKRRRRPSAKTVRRTAAGVGVLGVAAGSVYGVKLHNKVYDPTFNPSPYHHVRYANTYRQRDIKIAQAAKARKQARRDLKNTRYGGAQTMHRYNRPNRYSVRMTRPNGSRAAISHGMAIMHSRQRRSR